MEFNIDLGKVGLTVGEAWNPNEFYERLHLVLHGDAVYVSLKDNQGVEPGTDDTTWRFLVSSGSGGGSITPVEPIEPGDKMSVAYYTDNKLYWKKNGQWMKDPDNNMVPVGSAAQEVVVSDNDIEIKYSSITSPGNPSDNPSYWVNAGNSNTIWMAIRLKRNGSWGGWSILQVKGKDGQPGEDGADATSVGFKGTFSDPDELPDNPETGDAYIYTGETQTDSGGKTWTSGHLYVWDGDSWEDLGQLQGPPGENNFIHVAFSDDNGVTLTANNGTDPGKYFGTCITSSSTRPTTASSYTWVKAQGDDGFGYEFIYKRTKTLSAPEVPLSVDEDEYVPVSAGWTDDQDDVTEEWKYCWQCYRMKKNGHWGNYIGSITNNGYATLVARWGRDGVDGSDGTTPTTHFKSIVFTRTNTPPSTPNGGSYESPIPEDVDGGGDLIWSDGIPDGQEQVWSSSNTFHSDGTDEGWSTPSQMTDTDTYDVEFAKKQTSDAIPSSPNSTNRHGGTGTQIWFDPDLDSSEDFTEMYWRAERHCVNGEWGNWVIVRIKGEKGDAGTSITILGSKDSVAELPSENNEVGDSWLVGGNLYIWDGDSWVNAGQLQGPPGEDGQTPFIHIKYATKSGNDYIFTGNNGELPGDYIGIYWDYTYTDSTSTSDYNWTWCRGEDGFGYEYIFKATEQRTAPDIPTDQTNPQTGKTFQDDDFVPTGWEDNAMDLSETLRYRWKCWRKKTNGVWGAFQGSSTNAGKAILDGNFALDGQSGVGISEVKEYYAISADGVNPPQGWSTQVVTPTKQKKFLWNYEVVHYTNGNQVATPPCVIGVYGDGRSIQSVTEKYLATTLSSGITRNNPGWTTQVQTISELNPYLWNYEIITFDDGTNTETDPVIIGHFGANGAPGTAGVGIDHVEEYYAASDSPSSAPSSWGIANTVPSDFGAAKPYLWNYERVYYTNGNYVDTPACVIGVYGADGHDGRGIDRIEEFYLASANAYEEDDIDENGYSDIGWTDGANVPQISEAQPYLWNLERIWFTDGTYIDTYPVIIGIYTISALSTFAYLKLIFGEDNVSGQNGAILRNLLGVLDANNNCVAMLNASSIGFDSVHKKLMIAAGMTNVTNPGSAKFKVYEDGHVEMYDCKVVGEVEATSIRLKDDEGNTKLRISAGDFQVGSIERTVNPDSISKNYTITSDDDITVQNLLYGKTVIVPNTGGTRLFVPGFRLKFEQVTGTMAHSKIYYRMYLKHTKAQSVDYYMIDGGSTIPAADIPDLINDGDFDSYWEYIGDGNWEETTPQFVLAGAFQQNERFDVYIHYWWDLSPQDSGTAKFTCSASTTVSLTIQPADQGFSIGNNGFQMSLGDGFFISAINDNGEKEIFLSSRCDDGTDAWISLSKRGIYFRNKGDNEEKKLQ